VLPRELSRWFAEWVRPLHAAYYSLDMPAMRQSYAAARESLAQDADPDMREAKRLRLELTWFIVLGDLGEEDEALVVYRALQLDCVRATGGEAPASRTMGRVSLLMSRLHADMRGIESLPPDELQQLMHAVPDEDRGPNFWHELGCWAFLHRDAGLLDDAYVYFTTQRLPEMADFMFSRLRLMHHLMAGTATVENVLETLDRVEVLVQLEDFRRLLLPVCRAQDLVTPVVKAALDAKQVEMELHGKRAPERRGA
jgi:hypothetical protein